jgi:hypothetical protein
MSFLKFLNKYFFKEKISANFTPNDLNEQLNILKNIKNLQYKISFRILKKNAI